MDQRDVVGEAALRHQVHGFVCSCGSDVDDSARHIGEAVLAALADYALVTSDELLEGLAQMRRGDGVVVRPRPAPDRTESSTPDTLMRTDEPLCSTARSDPWDASHPPTTPKAR